MAELATGTVTLLFTDIESSTQLWERHSDTMRRALAHHDALLRAAVETNSGHIFKTMGDAFYTDFADASDAIQAAVEAQTALHKHLPQLRVRMALHTGAVELRDGDFFGPALNRVARLLAAGHGGQVLLSQATAAVVQPALADPMTLRSLGAHRLRDLGREPIFQLLSPGLPSSFPPPQTLDVAFRRGLRRAAGIAAVVIVAVASLAIAAVHQRRVAEERLVRLNILSGMHAVEEGDLLGSLPWFAEAQSLDRGDRSREAMHRVRFATALQRCPKLVQICFHKGPVNSAVFSPDGRRIVTTSDDGTAQVWDAATGQPRPPALEHRKEVQYATFSPDGRWVVTASADHTARVWDAATGKPRTPPLQHRGTVWHAAFSPDGRRVATASDDGTARVWDAATGRPLLPPLKHRYTVNRVSFSPDGRRVLTATGQKEDSDTAGEARVWDARTGKLLIRPIQHVRAVEDAEFSPDGRRVVTASHDWTARVWDAATGKPVSPPLDHKVWVYHASFSPDGRRVVTSSADQTARVWDAATGKPVTPPLNHSGEVWRARFSPNGLRVVTVSSDQTARVWNALTGEPLTPPLRYGGNVWDAVFSPDGRRVVTASSDATARVWDLATSDVLTPPIEHRNGLEDAEFSPDGRRVVTACWDGTARVWDATTGQALTPPMAHHQPVWHGSFSPDGRRVVTAGWDSTARIWDAVTGRPICAPLRHRGHVHRALFSPNGHYVVTASDDGTAQVWDAATGRRSAPALTHHGRVLHAAFSPDGRRVVTASWDNSARVWAAATGLPISPPLKHRKPVEDASFSPDSRWVVTASVDGRAQVWDAATGQPRTPPLRHSGGVIRASFSPDGRRVVTASVDQTARVWNAITGEWITPPLKHSGLVWDAKFSPDGRRVVTASWDYTARVWDAATGEPLTPSLKHRHRLEHAEFSPDSRRVVTASLDGTARLWDLPDDIRPLQEVRQLAQLLSGYRIDANAGLAPLEPAALRATWQQLRSQYPADFAAPPEQVVAWHRREAEDCERAGQWAAAIPHLNRLIQATPAQWRFYALRGEAYAGLSQWKRSAADGARAIELGTDDVRVWGRYGLARLALGDTDRFRRTCAELVARFGQTEDPWEAFAVARTCALAPNAVSDWVRPVQLARRAVSHPPVADRFGSLLLANLYRAGRFNEAVQQRPPARSHGNPDWSTAYDEYYLAMSHHRLGHAQEARQRLDRAARFMARGVIRNSNDVAGQPFSWAQRAELTFLRREAEALIRKAGP